MENAKGIVQKYRTEVVSPLVGTQSVVGTKLVEGLEKILNVSEKGSSHNPVDVLLIQLLHTKIDYSMIRKLASKEEKGLVQEIIDIFRWNRITDYGELLMQEYHQPFPGFYLTVKDSSHWQWKNEYADLIEKHLDQIGLEKKKRHKSVYLKALYDYSHTFISSKTLPATIAQPIDYEALQNIDGKIGTRIKNTFELQGVKTYRDYYKGYDNHGNRTNWRVAPNWGKKCSQVMNEHLRQIGLPAE